VITLSPTALIVRSFLIAGALVCVPDAYGQTTIDSRRVCSLTFKNETQLQAEGQQLFGLGIESSTNLRTSFITSFPMLRVESHDVMHLIGGAFITARGTATVLESFAVDSGVRSPRPIWISNNRIAIVAPLTLVHKYAKTSTLSEATRLSVLVADNRGRTHHRTVYRTPDGLLWDDRAVSNAVLGIRGEILVANTRPFGDVPTRLLVHMIGRSVMRNIEVLGSTVPFGRPVIARLGADVFLAYKSFVPHVGVGVRVLKISLTGDTVTAQAVDVDAESNARSVDGSMYLRKIRNGALELTWLSSQHDSLSVNRAIITRNLALQERNTALLRERSVGLGARTLFVNDGGSAFVGERIGDQLALWLGRTVNDTLRATILYQGQGIDIPHVLHASSTTVAFLRARLSVLTGSPEVLHVSLGFRCN
jgi:hypothetical protein